MATLSPQISLHVQKYLREGRSPTDLKDELGINHTRHPELPLVLFKYCQIDSPRTHHIVRECRGLILEDKSWNIVGKGFNRFFNVGELEQEFQRFNWNDFNVHSKEDGSLILLYNYQGEWHVNTSGSFGLGPIEAFGGSWRDLFWHVAPFNRDDLKMFDPAQTLVFELCTPYNKVVRRYSPTTFLLGVFDHRWQKDGYPSIECSHDLVDDMADGLGVQRPTRYHFNSQEEIRKFLLSMEDEDATFEGVILHDSNGMRYKWKTSTYTALHHLKDNGNVLHPKRMVPIILANEHHEVTAVMPECKTGFTEAATEMAECYQSMLAKWEAAQDLESQKDFALAVKDHPMASLLFKLRKTNPDASEEEVAALWRKSGDRITKTLFNKKRFKFDILDIA
jgi:hypothetical protein